MKLKSGKFKMPDLPIAGGCQCGLLRYRILAEPIVFYLCHCSECQRHTSSAFGESLVIKASDIKYEGEMRSVYRSSESGRRREGRFCPVCGTRIVHAAHGSDTLNVKAGTLDDTSWLVPAGHIWVRSAQSFVNFEPSELCFDTEPEEKLLTLARRWREMMAG